MLKAVFLDYTGTMVREDDRYTMQLLKEFLANSDLKEPKLALQTVWGLVKKSEWEHYKETFISKDDMVDEILTFCAENYNLTADLNKLHDIWRNAWIHAPLFDDVKPFIENCPLPIYVVTNDSLCYIEESFEEKGIAIGNKDKSRETSSDKLVSVAGVVSSEAVKANKPHEEILLEALKISGVEPSEAVLIGDSETSDVVCAQKAGITPVLLDRNGKCTRADIKVIHSLEEF